MCQGDLGERDVLTPFEECVTDELTRGNPDAAAAQAALRYARRASRLALALHDLISSRSTPEEASRVLREESEAVLRGE